MAGVQISRIFLGMAGALAATLFIAAAPARAQDPFSMQVPTWQYQGSYALNSSVIESYNAADDDDAVEEDADGEPAAVDADSLSFQPSASRRRAILDDAADHWRATNPGLAETLGDYDAIDLVRQAVAPLGLRTDNMADAFAIYWVSAWKAANQTERDVDQATYQAVRAQAAAALASNPQVSRGDDATKQLFAESMLIQTLAIDGLVAKARGNSAARAQVAQSVGQGARALGLDLNAMTLTRDGFVAR